MTGNGEIYTKKCDITNESDVIEIFSWVTEQLGGVDVLINNAGIIKSHFLIEGKTEDFKEIFDLNVMASCVCVREAIKCMRDRKVKGHVILLNSILGHRIPEVPVPLFGVYPASKYAITAISQTIRRELAYHKASIKVTVCSLNVYNFL